MRASTAVIVVLNVFREPFSPGVFIEVDDDECGGGDGGDGPGVESDSLEGFEVLEHGVGSFGWGAQGAVDVVVGGVVGAGAGALDGCEHADTGTGVALVGASV